MAGRSQGPPATMGRGMPPAGPKSPWVNQPKTHQLRDPRQATPMPRDSGLKRHTSYADAVGSYAKAVGSAAASNAERDAYKALAKEAQDKRNLLILKTTKPLTEPGSRPSKRLLEHKEWAELIFDDLEVSTDDVTGIDFHAGGINVAEIQLKEGVDASQYEGRSREMKGMKFDLSQSQPTSTKVTFKGVPLSVPDQELLHLVKAYGGKTDEDVVHYVKETLSTPKGGQILVNSTTRYINAKFPPTKRLRSFYWLQGPLASDPMRRITAEHAGQLPGRQCGNCLRNSADPVDPCPFNGKTAMCKKLNVKGRCSLAQYFSFLRLEDNYVSLKNQYMWSDSDEENTRQKYGDEFVGEADATQEEDMEELSSKELIAQMGKGPESNWAEEPSLDELKIKLLEKEEQLEAEIMANKKTKADLKKVSRESGRMRKAISHNKSSIYIKVKEAAGEDATAFHDHLNFSSTVLANCMPLNAFKLSDSGDIEGPDPLKELSEQVLADPDPSTIENRTKNMVALRSYTMEKIKEKLKNKTDPTRSRSTSRSRSEDEEDVEDGPGKSAKRAHEGTDDSEEQAEADLATGQIKQ